MKPMLERIARGIRPAQLVVGALAAVATLAALTALGGQSTTVPTEEVLVERASDLLVVPVKVQQADAIEAPAGQVSQPSAPRAQAARPPTDSGGGGVTNVTIENGSNDTHTETGGSNVSNDADVHAHTGVVTEDPP